MAITKEKKQEILAKLDSIKQDADSIVFVNFNGLGVEDTNAMRAELKDRGVGYFVAKKTLLHRAFDDVFTGEMPPLDGEISIAYSDDPMAPAQNIKEFAAKHKDKLSIEGGIFQGVYKNKEEMTEIASIPGLDTLRGMFVNVINSPIQGLAVSLNQIAEKKGA